MGAMAAMAASKSKIQKTCEKKKIKFTHLTFSLIFLLFSHTFENHQSIEYCPNIQSQNLNHWTTVSKCTKRISSSSLFFLVLVLLVATQILSTVSLFLVEMLLMRSGDVEPNPGPTILTINDLQVVCEAMCPVRADWDKIGAQLQIDNVTLKCLERENKECEDCLRLMLEEWLSQIEPVPCWEAIVGAVFHVGEEQLANSIRSEYCPQYTLPVKANQSNEHNWFYWSNYVTARYKRQKRLRIFFLSRMKRKALLMKLFIARVREFFSCLMGGTSFLTSCREGHYFKF